MLKKTLLATSILVACSSVSSAEVAFKANDKTTMTIGGSLTAAQDFVKQEGVFKTLNAKSNKDQDMILNRLAISANLSFDINFKQNEESNYGFYTKLNTNTSTSTASGNLENAEKLMVYLENKYTGRFEIGSNDGVYKRIKIAPSDLAVGTGGIDGDFHDFFTQGAFVFANNQYKNVNDAFYNTVNLPGNDAKHANKITYYAPTYKGFSAGFSFIPDTDYQGTIFPATNSEVTKKGIGYTNVVIAAMKYEDKTKYVDYGFSLIGNLGQAKTFTESTAANPKTFKRNDLEAFEVGGQVGFKCVKFAASYGRLGESGSIKEITDNAGAAVDLTDYVKGTPSTSFYSLGAAYEHKKFSFSTTYFNSSALGLLSRYYNYANNDILVTAFDKDGKKNKFESISFGVNYEIFKDISAFAEYTHFKYSKKSGVNLQSASADRPENNKFSLNKGNVVLVGLQVKF